MKRIASIISFAAIVILFLSCTGTRRFGTTIEPDEQNPCILNMIIQVAIEGTDADVEAVKKDLESCYGIECFMPCENDETKGCKTKVTVVVRKYSTLNDDERDGFHYVYMIDNDGQPSTAYIGKPNSPATGGSGLWRRNEPPGTYCHEVLHFCGLEDKYCSRIYDPVTDSVKTELVCVPPPEPNSGTCCTPTKEDTRCSHPCSGHENDLMATLNAGMSCQNMRDVYKSAEFDKCPRECCVSDSTFLQPPDGIFLTPGYFHFRDKNNKIGTIGISVGYSKYLNSSVGITVEGGIYTHTEKEGNYKQTSNLINVTGGVIYQFTDPVKSNSNLTITGHAQAGISNYIQKTTSGNSNIKDNNISFHLNIGAAANLKLNSSWSIRLLRADYAPTFHYDATQHNFRLSTGIVYNLSQR